jgi:hypothetical protein
VKKKDLAFALGLSAPMISKLCSQGMPHDSLENALAWRRRNIDPLRAKGTRFDTVRNTPMSVITAQRMGELAERDFATWADDLQSALRAVPVHQRAKVLLPAPLFSRMVSEAKQLLDDAAPEGAEIETTAMMTDADAELMGAFWYSIAAGEFVIEEGKIIAIDQPAQELLAAF